MLDIILDTISKEYHDKIDDKSSDEFNESAVAYSKENPFCKNNEKK